MSGLQQKIFIWLLLLVSIVWPARTNSQFHSQTVRALARTPRTRKDRSIVVGTTRLGVPINALIFGRGKKHIVIIGGIHGDESSAVSVAEAFAVSLNGERLPRGLTVVVIPRANPDGLKVGARSNSEGVDLNRNFPSKTWRPGSKESRYYPGSEPGSEPETQALVKVIKKWRPSLLISIHAPLNCVNWDGPAESVAQAMAKASDFRLCENIGYETPGSLGSYAGSERSIPSVTLELGDLLGSQEIVDQGLRTLRAALEFISRLPENPPKNRH
jgi:predicted deacylase